MGWVLLSILPSPFVLLNPQQPEVRNKEAKKAFLIMSTARLYQPLMHRLFCRTPFPSATRWTDASYRRPPYPSILKCSDSIYSIFKYTTWAWLQYIFFHNSYAADNNQVCAGVRCIMHSCKQTWSFAVISIFTKQRTWSTPEIRHPLIIWTGWASRIRLLVKH